MLFSRPWWWNAQLILTILLLVPIWYFPLLPLNDWPNHLAGMHLLLEGQAGQPTYVMSNPNLLLPNSTAFWFMRLLGPLIGVEPSGRLLLSIILVLGVWGSAYFMRKIEPALEPVGGLLGAALAYHWFFRMGFLNFALGIPLFLISAGYWISKNTPHPASKSSSPRIPISRFALAALLSILVTLTHLIGGLVLLTLIAVWRAWEIGTSIRSHASYEKISHHLSRNLLWDLAFILPILILLLLSFGPILAGDSSGLTVWGDALNKLLYLVRLPIPFPLFVLVALIMTLSLGVGLRTASIPIRVDGRWLLLALLMACGAMLLPLSTPSWQFAAPRLWPFFVFFLAAALLAPLARLGAGRPLLNEICIVLALLALIQVGYIFTSWSAQQAPLSAIASLSSHFPAHASVLPLLGGLAVAPDLSDTTPYFHAWGYWVLSKDVYVPYVFAEGYSPILMKNASQGGRLKLRDNLEMLAYNVFANPGYSGCRYWDDYYAAFDWQEVSRDYDYVVVRTGGCASERVPSSLKKIYSEGALSIYENTARVGAN